MKVLAIVQGNWGQRFVDFIRGNGPPSWEVKSITLPLPMPVVIDNPDYFLPKEIPQADLLLSLGEHPGVAELIPDVVKRSGAKAVIAPVDNRAWLPSGLARQIKAKLLEIGVDIIFPAPFCALTEKYSQNPYIQQFARYFGKPIIEVEIEGDKIKGAYIRGREAPCGNTRFVCQGLAGVKVLDAVERAGLLHHEHPCLASMVMDKEIGNTFMHVAGYLVKEAVKEAINQKLVLSSKGEGEGGEE